MFGFGAGALWGTPLTDYAGNAIANPTPILFATLQDVSLDVSFDVKELHGENQFPVEVARGKGKISGKAKAARINGLLLNNLIFGQTMTSSIASDVHDVIGAAIPGTPYQITPTVPSSGTWSRDLGVRDSNGNPMVRVASGPATGQYSVAAGVYTFAAADTTKIVFIDYAYTATSAAAKTSTVQNVAMGAAPTFRADLLNTHGGGFLSCSLFKCVATKLQIATKLDDYLIPEFDFSGFADSAGNVMQYGVNE